MSGISEKESVVIRKATADDAPRLLEIYAYYVEKTAITFEYDAPDEAEFVRRMSATRPSPVAGERGTYGFCCPPTG